MSKKSDIPSFIIDDLRVSQVIDSMQAHVWVKDINGIYIYSNDGCEKTLGVKAQDIIGRTDYEIYEPKTADLFLASDKEVLEKGRECLFPRTVENIEGISRLWAEVIKSPLRNDQGQIIGLIGMSFDSLDYSTEEVHDDLYHLAYKDILTGFANRVRFNLELEKMLEESESVGKEIAIMSMDVDFFQRINESFGHKFGDRLLQKIAQLLQENTSHNALIARIDGDEFAMAFFCCGKHDNCAVHWIHKLQKILNKPFVIDEHELRLSVSFGITTYPQDGSTVEDLMRNIDAAKNNAKLRGRNRYEVYHKGSREIVTRQTEIQTQLHKALEQDNFFLVYQGKYSLLDEKLCGYEALIRLEIPKLGLISPVEFIPLAESSGLIIDIGAWVIEQACLQGKKWLQEGKDFGHIAVNVSVEQLKHYGFINQVTNILHATQFPTQYLEMEITESVLMKQTDSVIKNLSKLKELGISLSMDDFGTGYSSLSYLKVLPLSKIKIDRAFVKDLVMLEEGECQDSCSQAIVEATIALAKAFKLEVIAEGIEYPEQAERLLELGCQYGQGFLYHKPQRF